MRQYRHTMKHYTCLRALAALLLLATVSGTTRAERGQEPAPQYDIELLVFQHLVDSDDGEVWPLDLTDYSLYTEPDAARFDVQEPTIPIEAETEVDAETGTQTWLEQDALRLQREEEALNRSPDYRPVLHLAWRQPVPARSAAQPVDLPSADDTIGGNAYVSGTATVSLGRYLHLALDLQLHPGLAELDAAGLDEFELPQFRLTESRRMRGKELHYFDHPRFGVLAVITPYTPPEPASLPQ